MIPLDEVHVVTFRNDDVEVQVPLAPAKAPTPPLSLLFAPNAYHVESGLTRCTVNWQSLNTPGSCFFRNKFFVSS